MSALCFFFFFQAEDGIRDTSVTGVQTCALPIWEILSQQAADPPSLSNLARQVGLNDRKLKEGFRQVFGTTAFSYLRDYRLQQAQQLLCNPNLSISSVAATVGYKSPESFCKAFRHKFAVSPKAYQLGHRSQRCG